VDFRLIAFYLPQYHPIPENDRWWGRGFTEWTNVRRAEPLFPGHHQPHVPTTLGYYDLRDPQIRAAQAGLARAAGIEAFCYWHYWFAGRRLLDLPFTEVLRSGEPDYPFCLAWANQSWTGIWHGSPGRILMEQTYPGKSDHERHFRSLLPAFTDPRYLTCEGRPVFILYAPGEMPRLKEFTDLWRERAVREGLPGLHLLAVAGPRFDFRRHGLDGIVLDNPTIMFAGRKWAPGRLVRRALRRPGLRTTGSLSHGSRRGPRIISYRRAIARGLPRPGPGRYPCVIPNWDNTPRAGSRGVVLQGSTPGLFERHLGEALRQVAEREWEDRFVFIKSWNEWAEGNFLEPEERHGEGYLEAVRRAQDGVAGS